MATRILTAASLTINAVMNVLDEHMPITPILNDSGDTLVPVRAVSEIVFDLLDLTEEHDLDEMGEIVAEIYEDAETVTMVEVEQCTFVAHITYLDAVDAIQFRLCGLMAEMVEELVDSRDPIPTYH